MKHINLKDLAKLLSLNPSTVSRALSDHPDIKPETKERVKQAALEFNYKPNLHARYFRQKTSGLIAVILPEFNMFFIPEMMNGINTVIADSGLSIIIFFSNDDYEKEKDIIDHCLSWAVDGVLISLSENTKNCDHLLTLKSANIPVVMMDKVIFDVTFNTVTIDDENAAFDGTKILIDQGKTNLLGIFGNQELQITKSRLKGFNKALAKSEIKSDTKFISVKDKDMVQKLQLEIKNNKYDGIFTMSDEILLCAYTLVRQLDIYPSQVSLTAISDGILPTQLFPPVKYVKHSGYEIGKTAASRLLEIKSKPSITEHIQINTVIQ